MKKNVAVRHVLTAIMLGGSLLMSGCSAINRLGANTGLRFTEHNVVPATFTGDDTDMACVNGEALAPVIYATGEANGYGIGADNDRMQVLLYSISALCAEQSALEHELRYMRAARSNGVEEAQDARIAQKRWAATAARRQYRAYRAYEHFYETHEGIKIGDKCPKLDSDFDQLVFMFGAVSGIQALVNDINSQNAVGVPKDIAAKVERAMTCVDSDKWWGVPMAVRAAIWNLLPGSGSGQDPWAVMKHSMEVGKKEGVRLSYSLYILSAFAKSDNDKLRDGFKQFVATDDEGSNFTVSPQYQLFDKFGEVIIWDVSDRYWTQNTGSRTPAGSLGHFWDEKETDNSGIDLKGIL